MSTNFRQRATAAIRDRYRRSAIAQYGSGLHTDCDDCAVDPADVEVPTPRRAAPSRREEDVSIR